MPHFTDNNLKHSVVQYVAQKKPGVVGHLVYHLFPLRRRCVRQNIAIAFGDVLDERLQKRLACLFYAHFAKSLGENLWMRFHSREKLKNKARVVGEEKLREASQLNRGVIILSGHFGNWELAPVAGIMNFEELRNRFFFVRKSLGSKFFEKVIFKRFYDAGLEIIPKKRALTRVMDALDANNLVVFIMDQHASLDTRDGVVVPFFGRPAASFQSLAKIARNTGSPVVPACSYRCADGTHVLEFMEPIPWIEDPDFKKEIEMNTALYNSVLEGIICRHPEQWLWMHRRWKVPLEA